MSSTAGLGVLTIVEWCIQSPIYRVTLVLSLIILVLIIKYLGWKADEPK